MKKYKKKAISRSSRRRRRLCCAGRFVKANDLPLRAHSPALSSISICGRRRRRRRRRRHRAVAEACSA
eukprot:2050507-Pleurochrysis_carterae.AAC.2